MILTLITLGKFLETRAKGKTGDAIRALMDLSPKTARVRRDGEVVEILSGLGSGDTVYYAYYDTLEESDAVETDRMKMY